MAIMNICIMMAEVLPFVAPVCAPVCASVCAADARQVVEVSGLDDERIAFTNFAETAEVVAFEKLPRPHLLRSWKALGVTVLKTVRCEPDGTAEFVRRQVGFLSFQEGADGVWLPGEADLPENAREAVRRGRTDREILDYLASLRDRAAKSEDGLLQVEARRVTFFFGWMPAAWENLDCLRLETVAWAKRLEQLLGLPAKDLPVDFEPEGASSNVVSRPFLSFSSLPQRKMPGLFGTLALGNGLSFSSDRTGFSFSWSATNGTSDVCLCLPGSRPDDCLPYHFHVDLEPTWRGPMAPATGRKGFLFGTDARFRPYSIAYGAKNPRVTVWPQVRTYGPDYPDPHPELAFDGKRATLKFSWLSFCGHWPAMTEGRQDRWQFGLARACGPTNVCSVVWPSGQPKRTFRQLAAGISMREVTERYAEELARTEGVWSLGFRERLFPFPQTAKPTFHRGERESDEMFLSRVVQPLLDQNANAWKVIYTDKDRESKFAQQVARVQDDIIRHLPRMLHLSTRVGELRRDYLRDRFAGREPPVPDKPSARESSPSAPDVDFDEDGLQLDDKEF